MKGYEVTYGQVIYRSGVIFANSAKEAREKFDAGERLTDSIQDMGDVDDKRIRVTVRRFPDYDDQEPHADEGQTQQGDER